MNDFTYTREFNVSSSLVEGVFYNANDNYVVLDLNDNFYRYNDVSEDDVTNLITASSVGSYYNLDFKHKFGPGEYVGHWDDVDYDYEPVLHGTGTTPKDFTSADKVEPTKEFSLQNPAVASAVDSTKTNEYSLAEIPQPNAATVSNAVSTVFFTLDGTGDKVFEFASNKESLDDAVQEVNQYVSRLNAHGKVVKVVFEFE